MRINICTLNGYFNYGNRLQLFALASVLKTLNGKNNDVRIYWEKDLKTRIKEFIKYDTLFSSRYRKESNLRHFTKKHIARETNKKTCDYSVFGSDQVWNPNYCKNHAYLLGKNMGGIKISYAASIGYDSLSEQQLQVFRRSLGGFNSISVREKTAKKLLQPLTEKNIQVVLDPTLLLDSKQYVELEKRPKDLNENEKYVLCYILGNMEYQNAIKQYSKKNNYKVIVFSDKSKTNYGVEEFLYLIHHAELICTDSFHACVFSFIFGRPFVVFKRAGEADYMYSRLQNFIETFHLENLEFNGKEITKKNTSVDYSKSKLILKEERNKSMEYLKIALSSVEK